MISKLCYDLNYDWVGWQRLPKAIILPFVEFVLYVLYEFSTIKSLLLLFLCGEAESFFTIFMDITALLRASFTIYIYDLSYNFSFYPGNAATGRYSIKVATPLSSRS
jgi:hypothetical protein